MIGNTIKYKFKKLLSTSFFEFEGEGVVIDAFTNVSGHTTGRSESFLGFGEGRISGNVNSERTYIVEKTLSTGAKIYTEVPSSGLVEITAYAKYQVMDEKIITSKQNSNNMKPSELMNLKLSVGKTGGTVVSKEPICERHKHEKSGHSDVDYYGGYLIAESIPSNEIADVIASIPKMATAHQFVQECYEQIRDTGKIVITKDSLYYNVIKELYE